MVEVKLWIGKWNNIDTRNKKPPEAPSVDCRYRGGAVKEPEGGAEGEF